MTFDEFMQEVVVTYEQYGTDDSKTGWRYGQTICNVLSSIRPELRERFKNSEFDCFYIDTNVPLYLHHVAQEWNNE